MNEQTIKLFGSKATDHWRTPEGLKERLGVKDWYDPCPRYPEEDGLSVAWKHFTFVNPPYSQVSKWFAKAHEELKAGHCDVIKFLVFSNTDTGWFHSYIYADKTFQYDYCLVDIDFLKGRVKFLGDDNKTGPAMRPSMVVTLVRR